MQITNKAAEMAAATAAIKTVRPFMSKQQMAVMAEGLRDIEGSSFMESFVKMAGVIEAMPKTYEQDGKGGQAVAHLHYFMGGCDWFIFEKDVEGGVDQAYGYAILNGDLHNAELGYISIAELVAAGVELDLHFTPKTFEEIQRERGILL
ncbi:DUF2958 domain-containing protein [Comamonas aquatica]|jgi:hypothetical protein|uniref:DUF2958 domain-containing protein n=1 Tax=Comamonas aquatica TaxID=225991 RepID=A0AA42HUN4_9BURK|nr:hypothetical protein [Comamonas aquatica]MDH0364872.1 DUF2958 domain-containing protein [Comamonas aquatica]MDH1430396.1 DUF2958 domain-containing protein [Comamonas aquatica]MDH1606963.1 DUF2958 domain-containing protein [Comamonas aquatica]MDH1618764.1 DUF2958 domain-containing protein [Comamonas aquatica]MDH1767857.1 DUF2958 domain-containing protein [Comamonas aquatica]